MAGSSLRSWVRAVEDWWFDTTRGVETGGDARRPADTAVVGEVRDSYVYLPVRAANARAALHGLPVKDLSAYTFVDMGSGKGRMLLVAAELPFRRVVGVEFNQELQAVAEENLRRVRKWKQRATAVESVLGNAAEWEFPGGPLVISLFNPFGPEIMNRVLDNLQHSLEQEPRHVVILMLWPEHGDVVAARSWLKETQHTRRQRVFENL